MGNKASNYMCVGTTFEKDGTTYVVREANASTCKGVHFTVSTKKACPNARGLTSSVTKTTAKTRRT